MHENARRLSLVLFAASLTACSGRATTTIPAAPSRAAVSEKAIVIGAASEQKATTAGQYSVVIASSGNSADHEYSFDSNVKVYRHVTRGGEIYLELHGKTDATFYPATQVKRLTKLVSGGVQRPIDLSSISTAQRSTRDCNVYAALGTTRTVRDGITDCQDSGPCYDCSGPMAPGGWLSCLVGGCGGSPEDGSGFGTGIFRSVDPQFSCEFNFVDGTYSCDFNVNNTESTAPEDLSNGYGYNDSMGAQLLHCKGPSQKSEAFVTGKNPDSGTGLNLGFHLVQQGQAVAHSMITKWKTGTAMNAQYFGVNVINLPVRYDGWCAGAN